MENKELGKGEIAEEAIRLYFLDKGYFVVRSIPFFLKDEKITDLDVWIYSKVSMLGRERINIDVKNKNRDSKPYERVIWAKGIKETLNLDRAIVATTSRRELVRDFAISNDIDIIDGNLLEALIKKGLSKTRLTDEAFLEEINQEGSEVGFGDWKKRFEYSKSRLISNLNFDGCNEIIMEIRHFMDQSILKSSNSLVPLRMLYCNVAYFLVLVDFQVRQYPLMSKNSRAELLGNGFLYGERGKERTENITKAAISLAASVIANPGLPKTLKQEVDKEIARIPIGILVDFFSQESNINSLFGIARDFEAAAYSISVLPPHNLPNELQSVLGLLCDFLRTDRKKLLGIGSPK